MQTSRVKQLRRQGASERQQPAGELRRRGVGRRADRPAPARRAVQPIHDDRHGAGPGQAGGGPERGSARCLLAKFSNILEISKTYFENMQEYFAVECLEVWKIESKFPEAGI
jgi:hypothetical protein